MIHSQLCLFFWLLIPLLTLQASFLAWQCRSVLASLAQLVWKPIRRKSHCAWCWRALHLMRFYPERWSSTMCAHHRCAQTRQLRAYRAAKQAALPETLLTSLVSVHQARSERAEPVEVLS